MLTGGRIDGREKGRQEKALYGSHVLLMELLQKLKKNIFYIKSKIWMLSNLVEKITDHNSHSHPLVPQINDAKEVLSNTVENPGL